MQLTIEVRDSAYDKIMYLLKNLKDDVRIIDKKIDVDGLDIEVIDEKDADFIYIQRARDRRKNGEKTYPLDEVIKEFE